MSANRMAITILILVFLSACVENNTIKKFPNPFNEAFEGSGVRFIVAVSELAPSLNDTLFFDKKGRLIKRSEDWSITRYEYDSNNYLKRCYGKSDVVVNYYNELRLKENVIYEYAIPIYTDTWEYSTRDIDYKKKWYTPKSGRKYDTTKYILSNGFVEKMISNRGFGVNFYYSDEDKLTSKESLDFDNENGFIKKFHYENNRLKRITFFSEGDTIWNKYFTSGLLDSVVHRDGIKDIYSERHYWE